MFDVGDKIRLIVLRMRHAASLEATEFLLELFKIGHYI